MRKSLWIMLAVLLVAIGAPNAHADTVSTFDASGTCIPISPFTGTTFSGTLTIDVTTGTLTGVDITFQGLPPFTKINASVTFGNEWSVFVRSPGALAFVTLLFTTEPTPGSLVGFTGGTISGEDVEGPDTSVFYTMLEGTLTPAVAAPEPSSVALMLLGVGLVFVMRKRIGQSLPQAS